MHFSFNVRVYESYIHTYTHITLTHDQHFKDVNCTERWHLWECSSV